MTTWPSKILKTQQLLIVLTSFGLSAESFSIKKKKKCHTNEQMKNEACYHSTTMICSYFLNSYSLTCFLQSTSQFPTYVSESCSWKMLSGSDWGHSVAVVVIKSIKNNIVCPTKKGRSFKKSPAFLYEKKERNWILVCRLSFQLVSAVCFLVSDVCPRPVTVTSYYVLWLVTIRGREHPSNSGHWLIIATKNTQFLCPLPLVHDLVYCRCTEKTLRRMRKGLLIFFKKKKIFKAWGQTQENNKLSGALVKSGYGCQRYWNILKFFYCCLRER